MKATIKPTGEFITRNAPGLNGNGGGDPEIVIKSGDAAIQWFHMP